MPGKESEQEGVPSDGSLRTYTEGKVRGNRGVGGMRFSGVPALKVGDNSVADILLGGLSCHPRL